MEDVLDLYHRPEATAYPLVCVDETSKQHIQEVRQPLGVVKDSPSRYDAEYRRNGVSNLFMIFPPFWGFGTLKSPTHARALILRISAKTSWMFIF